MATRKRTTPAPPSGIILSDYDDDTDGPDALPEGVYLIGDPVPGDRVKLFELEDRQYTAARSLPPNLTFKFLRESRTQGVDMATFWLIERVISPAVVDVLAEHDELTEEELKQIMKVVRKHTMGVLERASGAGK